MAVAVRNPKTGRMRRQTVRYYSHNRRSRGLCSNEVKYAKRAAESYKNERMKRLHLKPLLRMVFLLLLRDPANQGLRLMLLLLLRKKRQISRRMDELIQFDELLCDMTIEEEEAGVFHMACRWRRIDDFPDDDVAQKQTKFTKSELKDIFDKFDLPSDGNGIWVIQYGSPPNQRNYFFDTEQVFLYLMIRCRSGASHADMADDVFGGTDGGRR